VAAPVVAMFGARRAGSGAPSPTARRPLNADVLRGRSPGASARVTAGFERNDGQADSRIRYLARGRGHALALTGQGALLALSGGAGRFSTLDVVPVDGAPSEPDGLDPLAGAVNSFLGNDPAGWRRGVASFGRVAYRHVWPGTDVIFRGAGGALEYDVLLAPGADPSRIRFRYAGAASPTIDPAGRLVLRTPAGEFLQDAPAAYQEVDGTRRPVAVRWALGTGDAAGFALGPYDPAHALVIDPVLSYSSYLGGSSADAASAITVDGSGNIYVTGTTASVNFPTSPGSLRPTAVGGTDVFVAKFDPTGNTRLWATYLGGNGDDAGAGIGLDGSGDVYVAGETSSFNFPATPGALRTTYAGGPKDAFVARLNATGTALVYATYLGGSGEDRANAIAVDTAGNAYVTGRLDSTDFPATPGAFQTFFHGGAFDAFAAKLSPGGNALVWATYLGGTDNDAGFGIAFGPSGAAFVVGGTRSADFPATMTAFQSSNFSTDAFVLQLNPAGSGVLYSTFLGGSFIDRANAVAVDAAGTAWVTGQTSSSDFPTAGGPAQPAFGGGAWDAFLVRIDPTLAGLASLPYGSFVGGSGEDRGLAIAASASGLLLAGETSSSNFPIVGATQATNRGGVSDAFATQTGAGGKPLLFSTYLGGAGTDAAQAAAFNPSGELVVAGVTDSLDFPTAGPAQARPGGGGDAFVARYGPNGPAPTPTPTPGVPPTPTPGPAAAIAIPALSGESLLLLGAALAAAGLIGLKRS
jgi:hypothetical protein